MFKWLRNIRIALLHASYHRNLKKAEACRVDLNITEFQKYIYRAEDAWRKLVILTEKNKK
jgi:hypothetical protein